MVFCAELKQTFIHGAINARVIHSSYRLALGIKKFYEPNKVNILRITHRGELCVNDDSLGVKFCARKVADTFQGVNRDKRNVFIVCYPNASPYKIADLIRGLALGDLSLASNAKGLARVITQDYGITHILETAGVDYVKVSPEIDLDAGKVFTIDGALLRNPWLSKALNSLFHRTQRNKIIEGIAYGCLHGVLDGFAMLSDNDRNTLATQIASFDFKDLSRLTARFKPFIECISRGERPSMELKRLNVEEFVDNIEEAHLNDMTDLQTINAQDPALTKEFQELGESHLRKGTHALVVAAAGRGARFGGNLPKAIYKIFEKLAPSKRPKNVSKEFSFIASAMGDGVKYKERYGVDLPIVILASPDNKKYIEEHLVSNKFFGYNPQHIFLTYQTAVLPRIYPKSRSIALKRDEKGIVHPEIDTAATGHGFLLDALKNESLFKNISDIMKVKIETVTVRNIDNLGATVSDAGFAQIMGALIKAKETKKRQIAIELTQPDMDLTTGKQKDPGGSPVWSKKHQRNVLMEGRDFIEPANKDTWKYIEEHAVPFNTLTTTLFLSALSGLDRKKMPWYVVKRDVTVFGDPWGRIQFEQMWGDISKMAPVEFVIVERAKRFLAVKLPEHLAKSVTDFVRASREKGINLEEGGPAEEQA